MQINQIKINENRHSVRTILLIYVFHSLYAKSLELEAPLVRKRRMLLPKYISTEQFIAAKGTEFVEKHLLRMRQPIDAINTCKLCLVYDFFFFSHSLFNLFCAQCSLTIAFPYHILIGQFIYILDCVLYVIFSCDNKLSAFEVPLQFQFCFFPFCFSFLLPFF